MTGPMPGWLRALFLGGAAALAIVLWHDIEAEACVTVRGCAAAPPSDLFGRRAAGSVSSGDCRRRCADGTRPARAWRAFAEMIYTESATP